MWTFIQTNSKRTRYFIPGIVLAFSLLMGHVQFSCYYVIVYCIFQVVASVQKNKLKEFNNVIYVHDNHDNIKEILEILNIEKVDGILLDLGVSS